MTQEQLNQLKRGDIVRRVSTGETWVIIEASPDQICAIRSMIVTNDIAWEVVDPTPPQQDPFEKWLRESNRRSHGACGWDDNDMREAFKAGQESVNTTSAPTQAHCSMCGKRVPEADAQLRSAVYCGRCAANL